MISNSDLNPQSFFTEYLSGLRAVMDDLSLADVQTFIDYLTDAYEQGRRIFIVGNGGSAATASHMACDLGKTVLGKSNRFQMKRFAVIALTDNVPSITAWANDVSYDLIFAEQLRNLASEDDLLIVITGSGNSPNIVKAVEAAQELRLRSIGMLGFDGGLVDRLLDHSLVVSSSNYGHIEDIHMILTHLITAFFRQSFEELSQAEKENFLPTGD